MLVKLLFSSIKKFSPSFTSGKIIDSIISTEAVIAREIDTLIVEFMLKQTPDDVVKKHAFASDRACFKMIAILRDLKSSDAKVKWCTSWESKYKESSKDIYK